MGKENNFYVDNIAAGSSGAFLYFIVAKTQMESRSRNEIIEIFIKCVDALPDRSSVF